MTKAERSRLMSALRYDDRSGKFIWMVSKPCGRRGVVRVGDTAGTIKRSDGREYIGIVVDGRQFLAHRLAWLFKTGKWPNREIDHRDGDGLNNRWSNIRDGSNNINQQNQRRAHRDSATGLLGVYRVRSGRYKACICVNRKKIHIGVFDTPRDAFAAYLAAKRRLHDGNTL